MFNYWSTEPFIELLQQLIATPSHTRDEGAAADLLCRFFNTHGIKHERLHNNLILHGNHTVGHPRLLLNSHIDTVRPAASYTRDPYAPTIENGRLYGLGANDAGASAVALLATYLRLVNRTGSWNEDADALPFDIMLLLSAEEECGGEHGIRACYDHLRDVEMAIVGEPTSMQAAIAEPGLVVLDCEAKGKSGHAARGEGVNALYIALDDIQKLRHAQFNRVSPTLGPIRLTTTMINCGTQHNVVPDTCRFVVDVRTTDAYTNEQTVEIIRAALQSEVTPRSTRIRASVIDKQHPLVRAAVKAGAKPFVSTTTSDRTLMPFPALKIGPGNSARSHTADEYILIEEIEQGIATYVRIIENLAKLYGNKTLG